METKELPDEIPVEENEEVKTDESIKGTKNKNGTARKTLSAEDQKKRLEILAKGRLAAQEKRRKMRDDAKLEKPKPVAKPIPEPPITETNVSEPDTVKVVSVPKKKKKKKVIVMESSDSSSEEEVIIRKKKKKKPSPSPPPAPAPASLAPPPPPRHTQEELDNLRKEKIKQIKAKEKADKTYNSLFN